MAARRLALGRDALARRQSSEVVVHAAVHRENRVRRNELGFHYPAAFPIMKKCLFTLLATLAVSCNHLLAEGFSQPDAKAQPDLFVWTDTCNVYVLRDGDAAMLINLGDGSVLND